MHSKDGAADIEEWAAFLAASAKITKPNPEDMFTIMHSIHTLKVVPQPYLFSHLSFPFFSIIPVATYKILLLLSVIGHPLILKLKSLLFNHGGGDNWLDLEHNWSNEVVRMRCGLWARLFIALPLLSAVVEAGVTILIPVDNCPATTTGLPTSVTPTTAAPT
jgi:hypothetical protein